MILQFYYIYANINKNMRILIKTWETETVQNLRYSQCWRSMIWHIKAFILRLISLTYRLL